VGKTVSHLFEFGPFRLDTSEQRLSRDGAPVSLTPTVFSILSLLVRKSGHLVGKDEMLREVWPDSFVEEANLTVHISTLRKALGETLDEPRYVETIPRRGYRFVARVRELGDEPSTLEDRITHGIVAGDDGETTSGNRVVAGEAFRQKTGASAEFSRPLVESILGGLERHKRSAVFFAATLALVGATIALGLYQFVGHRQSRTETAEPFQNMKMTRLTSTGNAMKVALSPDGKYIAHVLGDAAQQSLWLRQVSTAGSTEIVPPASVEYLGLAFSHDGGYVFYAVRENNKPFGVLYKVPVPGGTPRKLFGGISRAISLSPDSTRVAFVHDDRSRGESALLVVNVDGAEERKLTARMLPDRLWSPAWSPDGRVIACVAANLSESGHRVSLIEVRVEDGVERQIGSQSWRGILYLAWLPDSSGLVMTAREETSSLYQIWQLARVGGAARKITNDLNNYWHISFLSSLNALAAVQTNRVSSIWVAPEGNGTGLFGAPSGFVIDTTSARPITSGAGRYYGLSWTPDDHLVYSSTTSGNSDIWIMGRDGAGQRQLTFDPQSDVAPSVSPDGRYVVFVSDRTGSSQIWRMDLEGGNLKQLTRGIGGYWPHCSPDGQWVVYDAADSGGGSVWRVPIDGGEPVRLTEGHERWAAVSPDGKQIACFSRDEEAESPTRIAVIPFAGGRPRIVSDISPTVVQRTGLQWTADGHALIYIDNRSGVSNIWRQPVDGGQPKQLSNFRDSQMFSFAWSNVGKLLACSRGVDTSDVVLLSDFR
jgi:Tol biopolymer transport system component/DNA-binding winged helix-turn-helix (wHTH) protein